MYEHIATEAIDVLQKRIQNKSCCALMKLWGSHQKLNKVATETAEILFPLVIGAHATDRVESHLKELINHYRAMETAMDSFVTTCQIISIKSGQKDAEECVPIIKKAVDVGVIVPEEVKPMWSEMLKAVGIEDEEVEAETEIKDSEKEVSPAADVRESAPPAGVAKADTVVDDPVEGVETAAPA